MIRPDLAANPLATRRGNAAAVAALDRLRHSPLARPFYGEPWF